MCTESSKTVFFHFCSIQFKCDFDAEGKRELYRRLETKIRSGQLYPVAKLVEYFIEVYKVMSLEGYVYNVCVYLCYILL